MSKEKCDDCINLMKTFPKGYSGRAVYRCAVTKDRVVKAAAACDKHDKGYE